MAAPAIMRITPVTPRLMPGTPSLTANARIAPITSRKTPVPMDDRPSGPRSVVVTGVTHGETQSCQRRALEVARLCQGGHVEDPRSATPSLVGGRGERASRPPLALGRPVGRFERLAR